MIFASVRVHAREKSSNGGGDVRTISDLLIDQIEFCNVLFINKCDLLPEEQLDQLECILRTTSAAKQADSVNEWSNQSDRYF